MVPCYWLRIILFTLPRYAMGQDGGTLAQWKGCRALGGSGQRPAPSRATAPAQRHSQSIVSIPHSCVADLQPLPILYAPRIAGLCGRLLEPVQLDRTRPPSFRASAARPSSGRTIMENLSPCLLPRSRRTGEVQRRRGVVRQSGDQRKARGHGWLR